VYDPTRFVFGNETPSIFVSDEPEEDLREYDFGGNALRAATRKPDPSQVQPDSKRITLRLRQSTSDRLIGLAGPGSNLCAGHTSKKLGGAYVRLTLAQEQAAWLANCTLGELGEQAADFYRALVKEGCGAYIPYDNRKEILGK
jgi:hypothetical protein